MGFSVQLTYARKKSFKICDMRSHQRHFNLNMDAQVPDESNLASQIVQSGYYDVNKQGSNFLSRWIFKLRPGLSRDKWLSIVTRLVQQFRQAYSPADDNSRTSKPPASFGLLIDCIRFPSCEREKIVIN